MKDYAGVQLQEFELSTPLTCALFHCRSCLHLWFGGVDKDGEGALIADKITCGSLDKLSFF